MRKNRIQSVVLHTVPSADSVALAEKVNERYVGYIERRLRDAGLSADQKLEVIDHMLAGLKADRRQRPHAPFAAGLFASDMVE